MISFLILSGLGAFCLLWLLAMCRSASDYETRIRELDRKEPYPFPYTTEHK